jgi:pseudaminic acid cytidylyltransferase
MILAVIPARGGSKRIPRKNLRDFCGKPILAWSVEAALTSGCFDRVVVSTDDDEVARVARDLGADVPFVRPAALADDHTGTGPVVAHAADACGLVDEDLACCIYATAPFVAAADLRRGLEVLETSGAEFAFSVTSFPFPIQRAVRIVEGGRLEMFQPEHFQTRSQDLEEAWHDAGQFYWGRARAWRSATPLFSRDAVPVPLPRYRVQDIDTEEDWTRAELLFRALGREADRA